MKATKEPDKVCNRCGEVRKDARSRVQYPHAHIYRKCYRLWKRGS